MAVYRMTGVPEGYWTTFCLAFVEAEMSVFQQIIMLKFFSKRVSLKENAI